MEAIVCARWVAESIEGTNAGPLSASPTADALPVHPIRRSCGPIVSQGLGVLRDRDAIGRVVQSLYPIATGQSAASDPALVGLMIAVAAYRREESRGGHCRTDFPDTLPAAVPSSISLVDALSAAREIVETETCSQERAVVTLNPLLPLMYEPLVKTALARRSRPRRRHHRGRDRSRPTSGASLVLRARQPGVVAGLDVARCAFQTISPAITVEVERPDGSTVAPGRDRSRPSTGRRAAC